LFFSTFCSRTVISKEKEKQNLFPRSNTLKKLFIPNKQKTKETQKETQNIEERRKEVYLRKRYRW